MSILNVALNPELANFQMGLVYVQPTRHAEERAYHKGIPLPIQMMVNEGCVVELEHSDKKITKLVIRKERDGRPTIHDVYVLVPHFGHLWTMITCWSNLATDNHSTLRHDRLTSINSAA